MHASTGEKDKQVRQLSFLMAMHICTRVQPGTKQLCAFFHKNENIECLPFLLVCMVGLCLSNLDFSENIVLSGDRCVAWVLLCQILLCHQHGSRPGVVVPPAWLKMVRCDQTGKKRKESKLGVPVYKE